MACGTPSSSTEKSSAVSIATGSPWRSTTVTSTRTRFASVRNVGGCACGVCGVCGACAARLASAAARATRFLTADRLEGDIAAYVYACRCAAAVCDCDVQSEKGGGEPDSGSVAFLQRLIAESLALVIHGSAIHERADADLPDLERRGQRHDELRRHGDQRIADEAAGGKSPERPQATELRLQVRRERPVRVLAQHTPLQHRLADE